MGVVLLLHRRRW